MQGWKSMKNFDWDNIFYILLIIYLFDGFNFLSNTVQEVKSNNTVIEKKVEDKDTIKTDW